MKNSAGLYEQNIKDHSMGVDQSEISISLHSITEKLRCLLPF